MTKDRPQRTKELSFSFTRRGSLLLILQGKQVQVIVVDSGENWSVDILHGGTLLDHRGTKNGFRVFGGKKRSWKTVNKPGRPRKGRE